MMMNGLMVNDESFIRQKELWLIRPRSLIDFRELIKFPPSDNLCLFFEIRCADGMGLVVKVRTYLPFSVN